MLLCSHFTDGLTDCQDPECCGTSECSRNVLCTTVADPADLPDPPDSDQGCQMAIARF